VDKVRHRLTEALITVPGWWPLHGTRAIIEVVPEMDRPRTGGCLMWPLYLRPDRAVIDDGIRRRRRVRLSYAPLHDAQPLFAAP